MRGSFMTALACLDETQNFRCAMAIGVLRHGPRLARARDLRARAVIGKIAPDRHEAFVDRTPGRDLAVRREQRVQIVLEVGQQKRADAGRLEQPHVAGFAAGHVDVRIERDLRAPQTWYMSAPQTSP